MSFGIDCIASPPVTDLKAAGVTFVCRYLSEINSATQVKLLTAAEALVLGQAGIAIVSNYEWYGNRAAEGFASGVVDAQIAEAQHAACGGAADRPIYFSVDFDTFATPAIIEYFKGIASVIGLHRTGAYGSYNLIRGLFDASAITWGWQTYAWSAGAWEPRAQIQQYQNGMMLAGLSVDYDRSTVSDFGQWFPGGINPDMIDITDPFVATYFTQTATNRWHCVHTNQDLFAGILLGWRQMQGAPRLPTGPETKCGVSAVYQECESGVVVYDPAHEIDGPSGPWSPCYLLKLDSTLAKQLLGTGQPAAADTTALVTAIGAIPDALATALATAVAPLVAKALVEAKKL
jgi:hypothetical protein